jgi:hypothetical protein
MDFGLEMAKLHFAIARFTRPAHRPEVSNAPRDMTSSSCQLADGGLDEGRRCKIERFHRVIDTGEHHGSLERGHHLMRPLFGNGPAA